MKKEVLIKKELNWAEVRKEALAGNELAQKILRYRHYAVAYPDNENAKEMLNKAIKDYLRGIAG